MSQSTSLEWLAAIRCSKPVFDPLDRLAELDGSQGHHEIFRIKLSPDAKAAAHVLFDEVNFFYGHLQQR